MALELGALREALLEGGVSPEKAAAAAQELVNGRLAAIERKVTRLTWLVGINLIITLIGLLFWPAIWETTPK